MGLLCNPLSEKRAENQRRDARGDTEQTNGNRRVVGWAGCRRGGVDIAVWLFDLYCKVLRMHRSRPLAALTL
jgi:hypothetical protein